MKGRITGLGGVFFRSSDPKGLAKWYAEHLEMPLGEDGSAMFEDQGAVWAPFESGTKYFGTSGQAFMINYRVDDLEAALERLRAAGAQVDDRIEEYEYGRFGWATDPEGNRFEVWEPS